MNTRTLVIGGVNYTVPAYIHRSISGSWSLRVAGINKVWHDENCGGTKIALNEAIKYLYALTKGCPKTLEDSMRCEIVYKEKVGFIAHFPSFITALEKLQINMEKEMLFDRCAALNIKENGARHVLGEVSYEACLLHWSNMIRRVTKKIWIKDLASLIESEQQEQMALF